MNQSQFLAITYNSLEAREKSRVHGAIGFGLDCHWLKNWRESFKPITKLSNRNHVITFDSHLKTALTTELIKLHCDFQFCLRQPVGIVLMVGEVDTNELVSELYTNHNIQYCGSFN